MNNKCKITTEEFILRARAIHGDKYDYSKTEYVGRHKKLLIICPKHGEFWQEAGGHLNGLGCPKCGLERTLKTTTYDTKKFIERAREVHGDKYDYSKVNYLNNHTDVTIICPIHGEFLLKPIKHLSGHNCQKCANEYSPTTEEWIQKAQEIHGNRYDYSKVKYTNRISKVEIICPIHGSFLLKASDHIRGSGCPKCQLKSQTKLYEKLKESFPNEEILFEVGRNIVPWLEDLRFDIYFPKYNIAVEYNGELHYVPVKHFGGELKFEYTKKCDEIKYNKCKQNNCTLFLIKYSYCNEDYNNLVNNILKIIDNYDN